MAARHKTAHRKTLEARGKRQAQLRADVVAELAAGDSLKPNAAKNARAAVKGSGASKSQKS